MDNNTRIQEAIQDLKADIAELETFAMKASTTAINWESLHERLLRSPRTEMNQKSIDNALNQMHKAEQRSQEYYNRASNLSALLEEMQASLGIK